VQALLSLHGAPTGRYTSTGQYADSDVQYSGISHATLLLFLQTTEESCTINDKKSKKNFQRTSNESGGH